MPSWDPSQYLKFGGDRLRPALDLMARIPLDRPHIVYDLGCGPGNITRMLAERWPGATVTGVDSSPDMLAKAKAEVPHLAFQQADIATWSPPARADLLFTNATLHWLDDHATLLPRLVAHLAPGGVLAAQIPCNPDSPSHRMMEDAAAAGPWHTKLAGIRPIYGAVGTTDAYYRILSPVARQLDIWETTYLHALASDNPGENPVVEWVKGTALRPYLDALPDGQRRAFLNAYAQRIATRYPAEADGRTLLPFRRIFFVAQQ